MYNDLDIKRDNDDMKFIPLNVMEPFVDKNSNWVPNIDLTLPNFNNIPEGFVLGFGSTIDNSNLQGAPLKTLDFMPNNNLNMPNNNLNMQNNNFNMQDFQNKQQFEEDFDLYYPSETLGEELYSYNKNEKCKNNNSINKDNQGTYKNNTNWQNGNMNNPNNNTNWQNGNMNNPNNNTNWQNGNMNNPNNNTSWQNGNMNNPNNNVNWQSGNMNNPNINPNLQNGNMNNSNNNSNLQNGNMNNPNNNSNWQSGNMNNPNINPSWQNGNMNNPNNNSNLQNGNMNNPNINPNWQNENMNNPNNNLNGQNMNSNENTNMCAKNEMENNTENMPIIQNRGSRFQEPIHMELLRDLDFQDYLGRGFRGEDNNIKDTEDIFTIIKDDKSIVDTFKAYNIPKPIYEMIIKKIIMITLENSKYKRGE